MASNLDEIQLVSDTRIRMQIVDITPRDGEARFGRLHAWAGAGPAALFEGPLLIMESPDLAELSCPTTAWVQVTACAHAAESFPDEDSFRRWQEGRPTPMAPDCFIPSGAFARPPRPEAAFAGRIEQAVLRVSPGSGRPFHHLRVRTKIGAVDVVADVDQLDGEPKPGSIVQGYFTLRAHVVALG